MTDDGLEGMKYYIAAEKTCNLIFCIEQTMEFMEEYSVKPDDEVKKALAPRLEQLNKWINDGNGKPL